MELGEKVGKFMNEILKSNTNNLDAALKKAKEQDNYDQLTKEDMFILGWTACANNQLNDSLERLKKLC